jgi:hypothetical protein
MRGGKIQKYPSPTASPTSSNYRTRRAGNHSATISTLQAPRLTDSRLRVACPRAHHHPSHVRGFDADLSLVPIRFVKAASLRSQIYIRSARGGPCGDVDLPLSLRWHSRSSLRPIYVALPDSKQKRTHYGRPRPAVCQQYCAPRMRLLRTMGCPMTKYLFDHRVTPGAEQPLTVPLFDVYSPSQEHLFVGGAMTGWTVSRQLAVGENVALPPTCRPAGLGNADPKDHDVQPSNVRMRPLLSGFPLPHYQ